jgi:hypothetical protein
MRPGLEGISSMTCGRYYGNPFTAALAVMRMAMMLVGYLLIRLDI